MIHIRYLANKADRQGHLPCPNLPKSMIPQPAVNMQLVGLVLQPLSYLYSHGPSTPPKQFAT